MMFSVWNQGLGSFEYYESSQPQDKLNAPKPTHLVSRTLGATVDQAAWPLPSNVRRIGTGPDAIGRVAVRKGAVSLKGVDFSDPSLMKAGLLVVSAFLIWKYVVRTPHRRHA